MLVTKNEFARMCGMFHKTKGHVESNRLAVYAKRGKILFDGDSDMIDTEEPINALFLDKNRLRANMPIHAESIEQEPPKPKPKPKPAKETNNYQEKRPTPKVEANPKYVPPVENKGFDYKTYQTPKQENAEIRRQSSELIRNLDIEKKQADLDNKKLQNQLKELEIARFQGLYIPVEPVKDILVQRVAAMMIGFKEINNNMLTSLQGKYCILPEDIMFWRKNVVDQINSVDVLSKRKAMEQLSILVEDVSTH